MLLGLRLSRPFSFIRTLTVGFGITPNLLTLFPKEEEKKALAGLGYLALTAGGDFHPALRTSATRLDGLMMNMTNGGGPSKALAMANQHAPMTPGARQDEFEAKFETKFGNRKVSDWRAGREIGLADSHGANPIPVCSDINNYGGDQLWTSGV